MKFSNNKTLEKTMNFKLKLKKQITKIIILPFIRQQKFFPISSAKKTRTFRYGNT